MSTTPPRSPRLTKSRASLPPAGVAGCPVLVTGALYVAGIPIRAERGRWMLGTALPARDTSRPTVAVMEN